MLTGWAVKGKESHPGTQTGSCYVAQAGLELALSDPPASVSHGAGITGVSHHAWPRPRRGHPASHLGPLDPDHEGGGDQSQQAQPASSHAAP
uniref:Uncharacterized protein n=1 Tax=Macaca fascicularis TaxID=9541 RepID=G7PU82_MACFA